MLPEVTIDLTALNISSLIPMLWTLGAGLFILIIDLFKRLSKTFYVPVTVMALLASLASIIGYDAPAEGFFGLIQNDGMALLAQGIIVVSSMLFIPLALTSQRFHEFEFAEFFALFLIMVSGFQFMVSSENLILIFVALETSSMALYTLIALHNRDRSLEAAIKYFVMGSLAAGFFAMGSAILYLLGASTDISIIQANLAHHRFDNMLLILLGLAFIVSALGFKLSIVPFHTWTPDVYEGASAPLAGYMSIVPKVAGFVVAIRLFEPFVVMNLDWIKEILIIAAIASMTIGNVLALVQESVKRMLAYSSVSHAGFVMTALLVATEQSNAALFLYWILFLFANLGAFTMLWISRHKQKRFHDRYDHPYSKFSGMILVAPVGAIMMTIFMLSLAGIPPFGLFFGKMYLISAVVNSGHIGLAIIMVLNSAIALYYYLKLVVYMFLKSPRDNDGTIYTKNITIPFKTIIGLAAAASTLAIFGIDEALTLIKTYLASSL
ncbi:MAG: NADH-quinone oxidoreductase subunit NuoN [Campylobacterales bacterium]